MRDSLNYYAYAKNPNGQIGQLLVIRRSGKAFSQEWTGKIYDTIKDAENDMIKLNCQGLLDEISEDLSTDAICPACNDPDCNRPWSHPIEEN